MVTEGEDPEHLPSGVWRWDGTPEHSWERVVSGRFWSVCPREGSGFWAIPRGGGELQGYFGRGERESVQPLPTPAEKIIALGQRLIFARAPGIGSGRLLWCQERGTFRPWALDPTPARRLEEEVRSNLLFVAANASFLGVVRVFAPHELWLLQGSGAVADVFLLEPVVRASPQEAPIRALALAPKSALFLARGEGPGVVALWVLNLASRKLSSSPAPPSAHAIVASSNRILVVDNQLAVWERPFP